MAHLVKLRPQTESCAHSRHIDRLNETERKESIPFFTTHIDPGETSPRCSPSPTAPSLAAQLLIEEEELLESLSKLKVVDDKARGPVFKLIKTPILFVIAAFIFIELAVYILIRCVVSTWEWISKRQRAAKRKLRNATTYASWKEAADALDMIEGKQDGLDTKEELMLQKRTRHLLYHCESHSLAPLMDELKTACVPTRSGFEGEVAYTRNYSGRNRRLAEHSEAICSGIAAISNSDLPTDKKITFLEDAAGAYGRTALCLSGGAGNGWYHIGAIKALFEAGMLPAIISGSSAGALVGCMVCCRSDDELPEVFQPEVQRLVACACGEPFFGKMRRLYRTGYLFDSDDWRSKIKGVTKGDMTFKESFQISGRVLNITVFDGENASHVLNYLTAPDTCVWSAVLASAAVPGALPPQELMVKTADGSIEQCNAFGKCWRDGSIKNDLPITQLHQQFNVNWTIVSQVEPHIAPFFYNHRGSAGCPSPHLAGKGWRGGFLLAAAEALLKQEMLKWLGIMRDFELLPTFKGVEWGDVFLQTNYGDVTCVPKLRMLDYPNLIRNPDVPGMARYIRVGEQTMWPKLGIIRDHRAIEIQLIHCRAQLSSSEGSAGQQRGARDGPQRSAAAENVQRNSQGSGSETRWKHELDIALAELRNVTELAVTQQQAVKRARRMSRVYHSLIALLLSMLAAAFWVTMDQFWVRFSSSTWGDVIQFWSIFTTTLLMLAWIYETYLTD